MASELAPFVHKFRATGDAFPSNSSSKVTKRNRQPLSCVPCRNRKLKCSRQQPCDTCTKRNDETSCIYSSSKVSDKLASKPDTPKAKAQDRLRQLEEMVMAMVDSSNNQKGAPKPSANALTPESDAGSGTQGVLSRDGDFSRYVGSTHWSAILENIQDLKATLSIDLPASPFIDSDEAVSATDSDALFGAKHALSLHQILSRYLPPRQQVDRLMSVYFNARYMTIPHIHTYQFQKQYEQFWENPNAVAPHWASMLFSICSLGSKLAQVSRANTLSVAEGDEAIRNFMDASAQCIQLGGFRPTRFVIESLALYAQVRYLQTMDPSREVGLVFAILVRLAYRMAYHRDPDNFSHFSPFEGEMRRRVWAMTRQFDLMSSFQLGLPPNVAQDSWDTVLPRNLLDTDFNEDTRVLPPSRPESEATQILYFIVKARLMSNFSKICSHALSFKNSTQMEISELDASVRATYHGVPDVLRARPMSQSFADPPYLIMVRLNCEFLYQKSLLVLHRKYMTQSYDASTKTCVAAAMAIVRWFADIHEEFKPGGQLYHDRWMMGSFTMNDFLLAAMVLCLATSQWRKKNPRLEINDDYEAKEWLDMLKKSYDICVDQAAESRESRKVAEALQAMILQLQPGIQLRSLPSPVPKEATTKSPLNDHAALFQESMDYSLTDPMLGRDDSGLPSAPSTITSSQSNISPDASRQQQSQMGTYMVPDMNSPFQPFLSVHEPATNIDWTALDTFFANGATFSPGPPAGFNAFSHVPVNNGLLGNFSTDSSIPTTGSPAPKTTSKDTMDLELGINNLSLPFSGLGSFSYSQQQSEQKRSGGEQRHRVKQTVDEEPQQQSSTRSSALTTSTTHISSADGDNWQSEPLRFFGGPDTRLDGQWPKETTASSATESAG